MTFQTEIEKLRRQKISKKFPQHDDDWVERMWYNSGIKYTKGRSASAIEKNIINYIKLTGHQAEKRAVTGREIVGKDIQTPLGVIKGKRTYIPSTGTKGASDVSAILYGIAVSIEVKKGRDTQKPDQKKYEQAVKSAGGFYFIAKDEDDFLVKWNELLENPRVILMSQF